MPCLVYLVSELSVKYWMKSRWRGLIVNRRKLEGFNSYNWNLGHLNAIVVQAQLREVTLKEENAAFENAISDCENKIKEKLQEADLLREKLKVRIVIFIVRLVLVQLIYIYI